MRQVDNALGIHIWPDKVTCWRWQRLPWNRANNREDASDDDNDNAAAVLPGVDERRGRQRGREGGDLGTNIYN